MDFYKLIFVEIHPQIKIPNVVFEQKVFKRVQNFRPGSFLFTSSRAVQFAVRAL